MELPGIAPGASCLQGRRSTSYELKPRVRETASRKASMTACDCAILAFRSNAAWSRVESVRPARSISCVASRLNPASNS